ncbi:MAG TPA: glycosyltransferase family 2 protein [Prolixibacteraceae bacterium]|nr:glycosyltransferase [Bacteroidales bacterium]HNZ71709.1 glycosyltransferase family 2 protein [Prolixibacteraceae bacterium]HPB05418.1 glycosyltransferase family 2 protein [Prolixibacteraceae bacterium]HQN94404.1 glycosyltransferase family 2 protein [Prolixibacteraceae bacterium]HUM89165.1 glycosyltransferase family 2 protein [Prolixibacteraceae bacterium]
MDISVVIPLFNEEESLPELVAWIKKVMDEHHFSYEIIMVDDGSRDSSWAVVQQLSAENPVISGISFQRNYGKAAALHIGFQEAKGDVVITMDADLQDSPDEIPELYRMITKDGYDLVSGWKKVRHDPVLSKNLPSKFYNWTVRRMTKIKLHDMNCGLKAYKKQVIKSIEVYGDMHRFIPVLAKWAGFKKIGEKVVKHQERKYGVTKFGLERFIRGPLDLLSVMFISKFGKRPMHLFGVLGTLMFLVGFFAALWVGVAKIYALKQGIRLALVTDNPYFYIALTSMIIGTQLFLAGFIADLVTRNSPDRNNYQIGDRTK